MKQTILLIAIFIFILVTFGCSDKTKNGTIVETPTTPTETSKGNPSPSITKSSEDNSSQRETSKSLPNKINLDVPFVSQAPFREWDDLHNEACEEASILGVILYLEKKDLDASGKDQALKEMITWQEENLGGHFDLPLEKVQELVKSFYHRQVEIITDTSVDSIKKELIKGNPIIIPAAGRVLGNPYFKNPGPVYHMLVIRGYDDKTGEFITNDVGTNTKGENFRYQFKTLINAIHDMPKWQQNKTLLDTNPEMIFSGEKAMLIVQ